MTKLPPIVCAVCRTRIWRGAAGDWLHSETGAYDHHATPFKPKKSGEGEGPEDRARPISTPSGLRAGARPAPSIAQQEKRDAEQRAEYSGCAVCNAVWHPDSYHDHVGPDHDANCFCMDRDDYVG